MTLHPSGDVVIFGRHDADWRNHRLHVSRRIGGVWSEPQEAPFNAGLDGRAAHFAPDGRSLLFTSNRSIPGATADRRDLNIWRVSWDGERWGLPTPLPEPINSDRDEIDAVQVHGGVIYFSSSRANEGGGPVDLYRASPGAAGYSVAPLAELNTPLVESTLAVTPDECLIVFNRTDDPQGRGRDDLFIAFRMWTGWSRPVPLGEDVNSSTFEYGPEFSPDRSLLYYTSHKLGQAGLHAESTGSIVAALAGETAARDCR
ncbi:sialidase family protein [Brevundimonas sp. 2R-24]|uniref:Sialidase family protein n=1 Tax=Peiella sedimenti TaxID=3061083 RepID=A0ABT8SHH4_9CAUL|nr:sialidase family protein [Caulobacteraceae bacterium XZ-24]